MLKSALSYTILESVALISAIAIQKNLLYPHGRRQQRIRIIHHIQGGNTMIQYRIADLADAYRKVKVDLFYSGNPRRLDLALFEKDLLKNLRVLEHVLNNKDKDYLLEISKGYLLCPKKVDYPSGEKKNENQENNFIVYAPEEKYSPKKIKAVDLRIIENTPIAFHIITTLWVNRIGQLFDAKLSRNAYGNRIRRNKTNDEPNLKALGTFNPYLHYYRSWRDNGLKVIRESLEKGKKVVAITADFTAFYHNIDPDFILSESFLKKTGIELEDDDKKFTSTIVMMLKHWADNTPLKHGLPVGCSISAVIANASLLLFDQSIERMIVPLYYGRYVDDIIMAIENNDNFKTEEDVWNWIINRISYLEKQKDKKQERIVYNIDGFLDPIDKKENTYKLYFESDKTRVLLLDSKSGLSFLDLLEHQIKEHSSEWRALPELPDEKHIASMLLSASNKTGEEADNLRKADSLTTRRALFAIKLRDFEFYCRNLPESSWKKQRRAFLETIDSFFTNLNSYFDMFHFFPRILSIATECSDYDFVESIATKVYNNIQNIPNVKYTVSKQRIQKKAKYKVLKYFVDYVKKSFRESIIASLTFPSQKDKLSELAKSCVWLDIEPIETIEHFHRILSGYDLASKPFRYFSFYKELNWPFNQDRTCETTIYQDIKHHPFIERRDFAYLLWLSKHCITKLPVSGVPQAWIFPTRPFNMSELYFCIDKALIHNHFISSILLIQRGYANQKDMMPAICREEDKVHHNIIKIQNEKIISSINVALASWKTHYSSWVASVCKKNDPDLTRYQRLSHLLNHILASRRKVHYVIFPELSIPPRWFLGIADKLKKADISLIGGIEYIHSTGGVSNQVWCSLLHDGLGFPQSVIIRYEKAFPAIHEEQELWKLARLKLIQENTNANKYIVQHGDLFFGILICSELTNIDYRAKYRGCVDAVFVPEWNQDTEMFSSLIEAAAYDVHAYVIQCNDRQYGDTRIRIPAKDHYRRDIVKIKGGEEDFFVIGKLDITKLRQFQSFCVSPTDKDAPFKPVPTGFQIAPYRKCLPVKNDDEQ